MSINKYKINLKKQLQITKKESSLNNHRVSTFQMIGHLIGLN